MVKEESGIDLNAKQRVGQLHNMEKFKNKTKKSNLWENVGQSIYKVSRLKKQIPQIKESIETAQENKALSLGAFTFAGYGKSKFPGSKTASTLMEIMQTQKVDLPWEGMTIGKYKANTVADYNSRIGGLEYKKETAYGLQFNKRF